MFLHSYKMKNRKVIKSTLWSLLLGTVCLATLLSPALAVDYDIALAHVTSDKEPINQAMEYFVQNVEERSDGQVRIRIYANGILGNNPELYEQVRAGAPIITISDPAYLSDFVADFGVLGGPYLLEDARDFQKIVDSDLYEEMKDRLREEAGMELLALNWLFGSRHMITDKAIGKPADIAGMTFRTPPNIMWVETFAAMGARPTQLAFPEVYSGLSAGVVEGAESPLPTLFAAKLYEVKKVLSLTGHFKGFTGLVISADYFASLPEDIQQILLEQATAAGVFMTDMMLNSEEEWIRKFEAKGVTVNRIVDIEAFRESTAVVYDQFPDWSDGLYARVRRLLEE